MKNIARMLLGLIVLVGLPCLTASSNGRATLFPIVHPGQILFYLVQSHSEKNTKTESNVVAPLTPDGSSREAHGLLHIEILDVRPQNARSEIHARSFFDVPNATKVLNSQPSQSTANAPHTNILEKSFVEFTIRANGSIDQLKGFDDLPAEQQQVWREWASKFAIAGMFPKDGLKLSEKWQSQEDEKSPSPIAGLSWAKDWQYVRDEPCHAAQLSGEGETIDEDPQTELCAVILSNARLRQKSNSKNSTPEDFRLHELKTMGTAKGENEVIVYISRKTGLVVRATEQAHQFMDVIVAKSDDSNRVHYNIEAKSSSEVRLVTQSPVAQP